MRLKMNHSPRPAHRRRQRGIAGLLRRRRKTLVTVVKVTVSGGLLVFLLTTGGLGDVQRTLARTDSTWLAAGVAVFIAGCAVTISQWQSLLAAAGLRRSFTRCLRMELAADAFDAALPTAIGGDFMRAVWAAETPTERVSAASSVILRRLCNFPGLLLMMSIGCLATLGVHYAGRAHNTAVVAIAVGCVGVGICASPMLGWLSRRPVLQRVRVARVLAKLFEALATFQRQPRRLLPATARGGLYWACVILSAWCYMRAVGVHTSIAYAAVVVTLVNVLSILPISQGGYGVREGAFSAFLAVGGLATTSQAVAVGLILSAQTLLLGVLGIPFYLTLPDRRRGAMPKRGTEEQGASGGIAPIYDVTA